MKCKHCGGKLVPKKLFCPNCGKAQEKIVVKTSGASNRPVEVEKVFEDSGITKEADKRKFLSELSGGFKNREKVIIDGNVGKIGGFS